MQLITQLPGVQLEQPGAVVLHAVQDDSMTRWFSAPLLAGAAPWTPPAGASAVIVYRRGDGAPGIYDALEDGTPAVTVSGSTVTFGLSDHALAAAGRGTLSIAFLLPASGEATERLGSFALVMDVQATPYPSGEIIESEPYINILSKQIAAVLEAAADFGGLTVSSTTLQPGQQATATVTGGSDGEAYHITFGIPKGDTGPTGPKGDAGDVPSNIFNMIYPVGAIYLSTSSADPGTLFTGTTWTQIKDRFLLAAGDTYAAAATGGSATHTLTEAELPAHTHELSAVGDVGLMSWPIPEADEGHAPTDWGTSKSPRVTMVSETGSTGSGTAFSTMPPYLTVYMWRRTA